MYYDTEVVLIVNEMCKYILRNNECMQTFKYYQCVSICVQKTHRKKEMIDFENDKNVTPSYMPIGNEDDEDWEWVEDDDEDYEDDEYEDGEIIELGVL